MGSSGHLAQLDLLPGLGGSEDAGVYDASHGEGASDDGTDLGGADRALEDKTGTNRRGPDWTKQNRADLDRTGIKLWIGTTMFTSMCSCQVKND